MPEYVILFSFDFFSKAVDKTVRSLADDSRCSLLQSFGSWNEKTGGRFEVADNRSCETLTRCLVHFVWKEKKNIYIYYNYYY